MFDLLFGLLSALPYLYWLLAIGVLVWVLRKPKSRPIKILGVIAVIVVFGWLPVRQGIEDYQRRTFAKEAWAHFKKLCDEKAGRKIYKTFTGVKSVVVLKPLPPATYKDLDDQYWFGDPYTNATPRSERGKRAALRLMGSMKFDGTVEGAPNGNQVGLQFAEYPSDETGKAHYILRRTQHYPYETTEATDRVTSRFGISWEDISRREDRKYWVAGSRLRIVDLTDQSIVAERIGYLIEPSFGAKGGGRSPWLSARGPRTTCPPLRNGDYEDRWFVLKAIIPDQGE